ncbi:hypothetical protein GF325_17455 [Candidatus Bathyarchaeota archaeon]|nr:hypothetical protein [Candidatus Bathyarchaeota archaeon]
MVFEKAMMMAIDIAKSWQHANLNKGISGYYDNFEENKSRMIEQDIESYEQAIQDLNEREKSLKKELRKDTKKQETLDEVREHLKDKKQKLKETKKELSRLPKTIKSIKSDFKDKMKELSKLSGDLARSLHESPGDDEHEEDIALIDDFIDLLQKIDKIAPLDEIIKNAGLEFKVEHETGSKKVRKYSKVLILLKESLAARLLNHALEHVIESERREHLDHAHAACMDIIEINARVKFMLDYYDSLQKFVTSIHIISIGVSTVQEYNYMEATQYFLKARELLTKMDETFRGLPIAKQYVALSRAYASDAFNIIYLLNSYYNWKAIAKDANGELKDIADLSVTNIQEWITKQYGFPPIDKVNQIVKKIIWPQPKMPKME